MTFLTRIDPASYGVDPIRRTVVLAFGCVMLAIAARSFQHRD